MKIGRKKTRSIWRRSLKPLILVVVLLILVLAATTIFNDYQKNTRSLDKLLDSQSQSSLMLAFVDLQNESKILSIIYRSFSTLGGSFVDNSEQSLMPCPTIINISLNLDRTKQSILILPISSEATKSFEQFFSISDAGIKTLGMLFCQQFNLSEDNVFNSLKMANTNLSDANRIVTYIARSPFMSSSVKRTATQFAWPTSDYQSQATLSSLAANIWSYLDQPYKLSIITYSINPEVLNYSQANGLKVGLIQPVKSINLTIVLKNNGTKVTPSSDVSVLVTNVSTNPNSRSQIDFQFNSLSPGKSVTIETRPINVTIGDTFQVNIELPLQNNLGQSSQSFYFSPESLN